MWKRLLCAFAVSFLFTNFAVAADYVLPYPSYMPGHKLYKISKVIDQLKQYWYWGTFASITCHMDLSDKYLVESKTLFEYKQYLLVLHALDESNSHVTMIPMLMTRAADEQKQTVQFRRRFTEEIDKHLSVLNSMQASSPHEFLWQPEKAQATRLNLSEEITDAIKVREQLKKYIPLQ